MAKLSTGLIVLTVMLAFADHAGAKVQTLTGRLVDKVCYLQDPKANAGDSHPGMASDCATTCAQKGSAVALLAPDGKLYEIIGALAANNNGKLVPHIARTVEITGDVTTKYGELMIAATRLRRIEK